MLREVNHISTSKHESIHPSTCNGSNSPERKMGDIILHCAPVRNQHKDTLTIFGNGERRLSRLLVSPRWRYGLQIETNNVVAVHESA
jgi:hypothetical protein